jgi:hypothetical protein
MPLSIWAHHVSDVASCASLRTRAECSQINLPNQFNQRLGLRESGFLCRPSGTWWRNAVSKSTEPASIPHEPSEVGRLCLAALAASYPTFDVVPGASHLSPLPTRAHVAGPALGSILGQSPALISARMGGRHGCDTQSLIAVFRTSRRRPQDRTSAAHRS